MVIVEYFNLSPLDTSTIECLDTLLATEYCDGIMVPEKVVNIERFGNFLRTFGPIQVEYREQVKDIFTRVKNICRHSWFFGDIDKNELDRIFRTQKPGSFLVRLSSRVPECFTLSYLSSENVIRHQRILNRGVEGFVAVDTAGQMLAIVKSSHSLRSIVEQLKKVFNLRKAIIGSLFAITFMEKVSDEKGDYSGDNSEIIYVPND